MLLLRKVRLTPAKSRDVCHHRVGLSLFASTTTTFSSKASPSKLPRVFLALAAVRTVVDWQDYAKHQLDGGRAKRQTFRDRRVLGRKRRNRRPGDLQDFLACGRVLSSTVTGLRDLPCS